MRLYASSILCYTLSLSALANCIIHSVGQIAPYASEISRNNNINWPCVGLSGALLLIHQKDHCRLWCYTVDDGQLVCISVWYAKLLSPRSSCIDRARHHHIDQAVCLHWKARRCVNLSSSLSHSHYYPASKYIASWSISHAFNLLRSKPLFLIVCRFRWSIMILHANTHSNLVCVLVEWISFPVNCCTARWRLKCFGCYLHCPVDSLADVVVRFAAHRNTTCGTNHARQIGCLVVRDKASLNDSRKRSDNNRVCWTDTL